MADFHALLRRQLRKHFGSAAPPESMRSFVEVVNEAYLQADDERMMMERAFKLSSQELLDANAELAAALEALRRAAEQSAEASRAKDEFLAMLGHELRNPLAPIVTTLDVAKLKGVPTIDARDIERPVRQVLRLVDDLLDIARVARGGLVLEKHPLELLAGRSQRGGGDPARGDAAWAPPSRRRPRRGPRGRRRRGAAHTGRDQPSHQFGALHRARRGDHRPRLARRRASNPAGPRQRSGDRRREAPAHLRFVRQGAASGRLRARPRAHHRAQPGRAPWRNRDRAQRRPRTGRDVRGSPPDVRRSGGAGTAGPRTADARDEAAQDPDRRRQPRGGQPHRRGAAALRPRGGDRVPGGRGVAPRRAASRRTSRCSTSGWRA